MVTHIKKQIIVFLLFGIPVFLLPCHVLAQNLPPVAADDSYTTNENTILAIPAPGILGNDNDPNGDTLTVALVSGPIHGTLVLNSDGSFSYTPITDFTGTDSFTYVANDGQAESNVATVTITVQQSAQAVFIDIKPGSCPNPFNLKSRGLLPVAILGTSDFNVDTIDPASIRLNGVAPIRSSKEDVAAPFTGEIATCEDCDESGPDGFMDLTLKFSAQAIVQALGVNNVNDGDCLILTLTGTLNGGTPIIGEDVLRILKKGKGLSPKKPKPHKSRKNIF